jgi:hypothetical protein
MSEVFFPDHVEAFIEATNRFLGFFDAKLSAPEDEPKAQARWYQIETGDIPVQLIVHRTERSFESPVGEYRARMIAPLRPDLAEFLRGKEVYLNRYATMGALVTGSNSADIMSQCLILAEFQDVLAGALAAAIVHARPSILEAIRRAFAQEHEPVIEKLSAWTDLDFEQIQYDHAHLGLSQLGQRMWTMPRLPRGSLSLIAVHNNPYWSGGLLCLTRVPERVLGGDGHQVDVNAMNVWANMVDNVPTFGGWCRDGDDITFAQFFPNMMKGLPKITDLIVAWARERLVSAPELVALEADYRRHSQNWGPQT